MQSAKAMLNLAKKVRDKHVADGATSLLKPLNWQVAGPLIDEALLADEQAEKLKRDTLIRYQQRDVRLVPLLALLRSSRDILSGVYSDEMKKLGEWGFDVMEKRSTSINSNSSPLQKGV